MRPGDAKAICGAAGVSTIAGCLFVALLGRGRKITNKAAATAMNIHNPTIRCFGTAQNEKPLFSFLNI
jgi:hypothetical protein